MDSNGIAQAGSQHTTALKVETSITIFKRKSLLLKKSNWWNFFGYISNICISWAISAVSHLNKHIPIIYSGFYSTYERDRKAGRIDVLRKFSTSIGCEREGKMKTVRRQEQGWEGGRLKRGEKKRFTYECTRTQAITWALTVHKQASSSDRSVSLTNPSATAPAYANTCWHAESNKRFKYSP